MAQCGAELRGTLINLPLAAGQLRLQVGLATQAGDRPDNQDFVASYCGAALECQRLGQTVAIADGMGGAQGGRVAAELAVREFIDGYYSQSPLLGVQRCAAIAAQAVNSWIHSQGRSDPALLHAACTLSALVLRGRQAHVLHVGDSRVYRLSGDQLSCLTTDHVHSPPDLRHVLYRAIGIEPAVRLEHEVHALRLHDRFLLCTDGVHGALDDTRLRQLLQARASPEVDAELIVQAALAASSADNATAAIIDVLGLPEASADELHGLITALPLLPAPKSGDLVDGFQLEELLSDGRYSRLYRATDTLQPRQVVLKFPQASVASASTYQLAFVREAWVAARIQHPHVGELIALPRERQTRLYSVMPYYDGETLAQRLGREPRVSLSEGVGIALKLCRAVIALHRAGIIHRDIKPDNVIVSRNGELKLIDLGVVRLPRMEEFPAADIPGTPSYLAPECFAGEAGNEQTDQYALGVSLYRLYTRQYPYGEIEPFSRPRFGKPALLARYRPDLPAWLGATVEQMLQPDPARRFGDLVECLLELETGLDRGASQTPPPASLYQRNPLGFWQFVSALLLLALLASLALR